MLAPATTAGSTTANLPAGFTTGMPAINSNYQALLGNTNASVTPQFAGYNPVKSATVAPYNFYPAAAVTPANPTTPVSP